MNRIKLIPALLFLLAACSPKEEKVPSEIRASVNINFKGEPISPYLYGMFLENLGNADVGNLVDDCLWSELLDDRKFFYPIDRKDEQNPPNKKDTTNQWTPFHNDVMMDSIHPYVGIHSPKIKTNKTEPEGILQLGIPLVRNKKYVGRIVLSGSSNVKVKISLIWGNDPTQKDSFTIEKLTSDYSKFNFKLACGDDSKKGRLEITGLGDGSFSVGAVSLMPEDNVSGFRADAIGLLRDLNSGLYRWGGNMSSAYDWRDGIGDPDRRPSRYEYAWNALESNDVGTHELAKFAELVNVQLCLSANAGLGDAYSAGQWVEYTNGSVNTPMGKLRTANGHPEPFGIKLWCVGNEMYGWWQLGHTDLISTVIKYNMFAEKMHAADPSIKLIASGATIDEMTITESARKINGKIVAEYDSATDWTGGLLRHCLKDIDYMSEHFYCSVDQRFDLTKGKYINVDEPLVDWTRRPANRVRAKAEHYNEYHKRIPGSEKIPVYIDEWAYFTNWVHPTPTLGVTIGYARALHEMIRNSDLIKMAGFTFGTSCLSFNYTDVTYNASGLLFKLYGSQLGTIPVEVTGNSPQPKPNYPIGGDQPSVNAGGDSYPLDMIAALTNDQKTLTIAIINPTESDQKMNLQLNDLKVSGKGKKWTISGTSIMARNIVGKEPQVHLNETDVNFSENLIVQGSSINIYRFEILK